MSQPSSSRRRFSLSLGKRFALGFGVILVLLLAVSGISHVLLSRISRSMNGIVEVNNRQMALARQMIDELNDMAITLRTVTLLTSVKEVDEQVKLLEGHVTAYQLGEGELAKTLVANSASAAEHELMAKIHAVGVKTLPLVHEAAKMAADGATPEATNMLMKDVRPVEQEWRVLVTSLVTLEEQLNAQAYDAGRRAERLANVVLVAVSALAIAVGGLIAWRLARLVLTPVLHAIAVTERIAQGDLSSAIHSDRDDELGRLVSALGNMQERLRTLVSKIRSSAESISTASAEIASGNHDLSQRTEQQATSLQKTTSNVEHLTGTVRVNAESAQQADQLATRASEIAMRGGAVVDQVVTTMADISSGSTRIADIIGVIDGIAFQTNILALNAAVEAARAGEQGRGFAVVAAEVRHLAQRSAASSKEIRTLIGATGDRVTSGAKLVEDAGATMRETVASIQRVTSLMAEITVSAAEQSRGIGQVSGEVGQLDQMTQQNAALVKQSAVATESLRTQADTLAEAVGAFKLEA